MGVILECIDHGCGAGCSPWARPGADSRCTTAPLRYLMLECNRLDETNGTPELLAQG
jgi:hypothetical protein